MFDLCKWLGCCRCPPFVLRIGPVTEQRLPAAAKHNLPFSRPLPPFRKFKVILMATITDSQDLPLGPLQFTDKKGNPVPNPTGITVAWSVDNPNLLALTPSADGLSCVASAVGPLGTAMVSVAVADSSGNPSAGGSVEVDIVSGAPTKVVIPTGTPTEQP